MSAGYIPLLESTAGELRRRLHEPAAHVAARLAELSPTAHNCAACQALGHLDSGDATDEPDEVEGLCLPHLQVALASGPAAEVGARLIADQARRLEELAEDMHSYSLKRDAVR